MILKMNGIMDEGASLHIVASLVSGFCATTTCAPADLIKTRIMCDSRKELYRNPIDCVYKTLKYDWVMGLLRGWLPSYVRIGPHLLLLFLCWNR